MVSIREESPADVEAIRQIHLRAFPSPLESQLVDSLRAAGHATLSLVAMENDGAVVGHVLFSPVSVGDHTLGEFRGLGLAPLAVMPEAQSKGVGSALIRAGLAAACDAGWRFVVVLGEPAYYHRFGFSTASGRGLANEYGVDEPFMVLELVPGALTGVAGLVRYAPEFAAFA